MSSSFDLKTLGLASAVGTVGAGLLKEIKPNEHNKTGVDEKSFLDTLKQTNEKTSGKSGAGQLSVDKTATELTAKPLLKFSNHALERMNTRGIHFSPEQITKIEQGMQKAISKGAKEALVLSDDSALIVSLKNNMVVTVMDKSMLKENVFTNIDSTVFV